MKISPRDVGPVSVGIELVLSVLLCLAGGHWLDGRLHTTPWFSLLGIALGFAAGMRSLIRMMRRNARRDAAEDRAREAQTSGATTATTAFNSTITSTHTTDGSFPDERKP